MKFLQIEVYREAERLKNEAARDLNRMNTKVSFSKRTFFILRETEEKHKNINIYLIYFCFSV